MQQQQKHSKALATALALFPTLLISQITFRSDGIEFVYWMRNFFIDLDGNLKEKDLSGNIIPR